MPMKLVFDNDGHVVVQDGKPVYEHDDGKQIPFDAGHAMQQITDLNAEAKKHRLNFQDADNKLKTFDGIDPVKAREAIETVENLDNITKGKIDAVKTQMAENFATKERQMIENFENEKKTLSNDLTKANDHIFTMTVEKEFLSSPLFNGSDPKTTMTPDVATALFKNHFTVDTEGDTPRIIATINGEEILSRERAGQPASFHEAMDVIWEKYPNRTRYEAQNNGGGGGGNRNNNHNQDFKNPQERIANGLRNLRK